MVSLPILEAERRATGKSRVTMTAVFDLLCIPAIMTGIVIIHMSLIVAYYWLALMVLSILISAFSIPRRPYSIRKDVFWASMVIAFVGLLLMLWLPFRYITVPRYNRMTKKPWWAAQDQEGATAVEAPATQDPHRQVETLEMTILVKSKQLSIAVPVTLTIVGCLCLAGLAFYVRIFIDPRARMQPPGDFCRDPCDL